MVGLASVGCKVLGADGTHVENGNSDKDVVAVGNCFPDYQ